MTQHWKMALLGFIRLAALLPAFLILIPRPPSKALGSIANLREFLFIGNAGATGVIAMVGAAILAAYIRRNRECPQLLILLSVSGYMLLNLTTASTVNEVCSNAIVVQLLAGLAMAMVLARSVTAKYAFDAALVINGLAGVIMWFNRESVLFSANLPRAGGLFNDPNTLSLLLCLGIALLRGTKKPPAYEHFVLFLLVVSLCLTWHRLTFISLALAEAAAFFCTESDKRRNLLWLSVFLFLALLTFVVRHSGPLAASSSRSNSGRAQAAIAGVTSLRESLPWGVGIGNVRLPIKVTRGGNVTEIYVYDAKNEALTIVMETGLNGILLMSMFLTGLGLAFRRHSARNALARAWIVVLSISACNTPFLTIAPSSNVILGVLVGLTVLYAGNEPTNQTDRRFGTGRTGLRRLSEPERTR